MAKKRARKRPSKNSSSKDFIRFKRPNPWVVAAIVLIIVIILWLISGSSLNFKSSGLSIGESEASKKVLDFAKNQGAEATLVGISKKSGIYEVLITIQENEIPVYITLDGEYLIPNIVSFNDIMNAAQK